MTESNEPIARLEKVSKKLKDKQVLVDVNLTLETGKVTSIQGPNGTGKSILLRIMCGLVFTDTGSVVVCGKKLGVDADFAPDTGVLIDSPGFLDQYCGLRNLELLASIRGQIGKEQITETMHMVGLDPTEKKPVKTYSTGMRQKLGLAQAIMEKPKLLLLDEPTNGLDKASVAQFRQNIHTLVQQGVTILFTSHHEDEINELSQHRYLLENGVLEKAEVIPTYVA